MEVLLIILLKRAFDENDFPAIRNRETLIIAGKYQY
jgi:hypothetical protein